MTVYISFINKTVGIDFITKNIKGEKKLYFDIKM